MNYAEKINHAGVALGCVALWYALLSPRFVNAGVALRTVRGAVGRAAR